MRKTTSWGQQASGQGRPRQAQAVTRGKRSCRKPPACLPEPWLSREMKRVFPSSLPASSLSHAAATAIDPRAPRVPPRLPSQGAEGQGCHRTAPPGDTFPAGAQWERRQRCEAGKVHPMPSHCAGRLMLYQRCCAASRA